MVENALQTLELEEQSKLTLADVKTASRRLILKYHPDVNPDRPGWAAANLKKVVQAYHELEKAFEKEDVIYYKPVQKWKPGKIRNETEWRVVPRHLQLFSFMIGSDHCAIDVSRTHGVRAYSNDLIDHNKPQFLGELFTYLVGMMTWQDRILPVIDIAPQLGLNSELSLEQKQVLICDCKAQYLGVLIDRGVGVLSIERPHFSQQKTTTSRHLTTIYRSGNRAPVLMIELEALFAPV